MTRQYCLTFKTRTTFIQSLCRQKKKKKKKTTKKQKQNKTKQNNNTKNPKQNKTTTKTQQQQQQQTKCSSKVDTTLYTHHAFLRDIWIIAGTVVVVLRSAQFCSGAA